MYRQFLTLLHQLDLGNIRAQRIRNEQDEYQDVVDPRALEASRRANQQGTAEATWANRPEAVTALAGWNGKLLLLAGQICLLNVYSLRTQRRSW